MKCVDAQQTLTDGISDLTSIVQSLGTVRALAWYAFEQSTTTAAPISTGSELTNKYFQSLVDAYLLRPAQRSDAEARCSLYDRHHWLYINPQLSGMSACQLLSRVRALSRRDITHARLALWHDLADAELRTYTALLFKKSGYPSDRVDEFLRLMDCAWRQHPLGIKRYLAWHGMRLASSIAPPSGSNSSVALQVLCNEVCRKSHWLSLMRSRGHDVSAKYTFAPPANWRKPILLGAFQSTFLANPQIYWMSTPH